MQSDFLEKKNSIRELWNNLINSKCSEAYHILHIEML